MIRPECEQHHTPARDNQYRATARYYKDSCPYCEIDRLKGELEEAQKRIEALKVEREVDNEELAISIKERIDLGGQLAESMEREANLICRCNESTRREYVAYNQLAEANHTIERLVSEAANTPDLLKQLAEAREWKKAAQSVMLPYQDIARELNIGLGESIHDKVLPCIVDLKSELAEARAEVERLTEGKANRATREHAELVEKVSRLKVEIKRLNTLLDEAMHDYFCDMSKRLAEARQEAARSILQIISMETIDRPFEQSQSAEIIKAKFKLEGG